MSGIASRSASRRALAVQRIDDRVDDSRRRADRAQLADALGTGKVGGARDQVSNSVLKPREAVDARQGVVW